MKFISLFSGIGGLDLGLEWAGWECVAQVEKDEYCRRVLAKHWPDVPRFEDVRNVGRDNLPAAAAVVGGFPCQPHSVAGKRRGAADDRNLWPDYLRIITELRPAWVVGENVPGIIYSGYIDTVLLDLEGADYTTGTFILPSEPFGPDQLRERVFIVAHANGIDGGWGGGRVFAASQNGRGRHNNGGRTAQPKQWERWQHEPRPYGVAHGISNRVDRLRGLGNAVVPQVAEFVGRMILESGL